MVIEEGIKAYNRLSQLLTEVQKLYEGEAEFEVRLERSRECLQEGRKIKEDIDEAISNGPTTLKALVSVYIDPQIQTLENGVKRLEQRGQFKGLHKLLLSKRESRSKLLPSSIKALPEHKVGE